jgi:acetylornithine deacetylase/succinyl-diaminopimelate desuccinylase-like protein
MSMNKFLSRSAARASTLLLALLALLSALLPARAAPPAVDWNKVGQAALETLRDYVRIDTTNPPGDTRKTAEFLTAILAREGIPVRRFESTKEHVVLLARLPANAPVKGRKPILLLHHMDVVPADAQRWPVPPFSAELRDGHLWGRGAVDMKGIGVTHLYAFLQLKKQDTKRTRDVILMAVPDEEAGGRLGTRFMIEKHYADLDPEYVLDEGGCGSRDLFADNKLVFGIGVAEKKILWLKLRAEGVAGHGSQPHPENPNDRLVRALSRLLATPLPSGEIDVVKTLRQRVGTLASNKYMRAIERSTVALTTLRSGVGEPPKANVIPSWAEATLDCRVLPGTKKADWLAALSRRLDDDKLILSVLYESDDPIVTPTDTPFYRAFETTLLRHHPDAVVTPILIPYGTDSNAFRPRGVKSYGFFPVILPAAIVATMHSDAERIPTSQLAPGLQILYEALRDVLEKP